MTSPSTDLDRRLRRLINALPTAVYMTDGDGYISLYNDAAARLWGRQPEIGKDRWCGSWRIFHPQGDAVALDTCPMARAIREGTAILGAEIVVERPDGTRRNVLPHPKPLVDSSGSVTGAINMLVDITEHRQAQTRLRESEQRFRAIFDHAGVGITMRPVTGRALPWTEFNDQFCKLLGYERHELGKLSTADITPPEVQQDALSDNARMIRGEISTYVREKQIIGKNGRRIWVNLAVASLQNDSGQAGDLISVYQDITERKAAEAALVESELFSKSTIDALFHHLCVLDEDGTIIAVNKAWREFGQANGLTRGSAETGANYLAICDAVTGPDAAEARAFAAGIRSVIDGEQDEFVMEYPCHSPGEQRWFLGRVTRFPGTEPKRLVITHANFTERKLAEIAVKLSETRLRAILDNGPDCVKVVAADGTLVEINNAGLVMLGARSIEEVQRRGIINFIDPADRAGYMADIRRVFDGTPCISEFRVTSLDGTARHLESHATAIHLPENGGTLMLAITRDITARKKSEEQIAFLYQYDSLTGLPNRNLLRDRIDIAVARARRLGEMTGIIALNLDRFRKVNESLGAVAGDELLRAVAARLRATLCDVDSIARIAGNEFAVLLEGITAENDFSGIADKLLDTLAAPFHILKQDVLLTASLGVAVSPDANLNGTALLANAEAAMKLAKQEGGNGFRIYSSEAQKTQPGKRLTMETCLSRAIENHELELHYQPKVSLSTGAIIGVEALVRWNSPRLGPVSPAQFIPIAEETGLIIPVGKWILHTACTQAKSWQESGYALGMGVNLSPRQFRQKNLLGIVADLIDETGLDPERLELEVTETATLTQPEQAATLLSSLRGLGVRIALDDFGTGYSSLSHLRHLPIDTVKIDRSFIQNIVNEPRDHTIVANVARLARDLGMWVVAEGVEDRAQHHALCKIGCDAYQGYMFSPALPADRLEALLTANRHREGGIKSAG